MKIRVPKHDLLDALNKVKTVISSKTVLPILSHVLIETLDSGIRITSTDLKVSIECEVPCDVQEAGSLTLASHRLATVVSEFPDGDIVLSLGDNRVVEVICGRIQTKLFSMSPNEFPPVRRFEGIEPIVLRQGTLKNIFSKTSFAICTDQARYNLTGLLFELAEDKLIGVATDGKRMSLYIQFEEGTELGSPRKVIIPGKMIAELERLLGDDGDVSVFIDESQAGFSFDSVRLISALIEGSFPNYEVVIPKKHDKEVILQHNVFSEAIRRTRTMTSDKFNSVRFSITPGKMTLLVVTPDVGEYEEEIAVEYEGEKIEIAFNPDFIWDVLRRIDTERLCLVLKDSTSPGIIKPVLDKALDENYINVIMPIRI